MTQAGKSLPSIKLPSPLRSLFWGLRWRIRAYAAAEGLGWTLFACALLIFLSLAIDWHWSLPRQARLIFLCVSGALIAWIFTRKVLFRVFSWLSNRGIASLVERRYPQIRGKLLTVVELAEDRSKDARYSPYLLASAVEDAVREAAYSIDLPSMFRARPLRWAWILCACCWCVLGASVLFFPTTWRVWSSRNLALSNVEWKRDTRLLAPQFKNGVAKVARGANFDLEVLAETVGKVPEVVRIRYRTDEGARGNENLARIGRALAGIERYQPFRHQFEGLLSSVSLSVSGGDARLEGLRIEVVDPPSVSGLTMDCEFPPYTGRTPVLGQPVAGLMQFPLGSRLVLHGATNKPLASVHVSALKTSSQTAEVLTGEEVRGSSFHQPLPPLLEDIALLVGMTDEDGIASRQPLRISLAAIPDEPPRVESRLVGIGSKVTPNARIPFAGKLSDDYGVAASWMNISANEGEALRVPFQPELPDGGFKTALEVREHAVKPGDRLMVGVIAEDACALAEGAHQAGGPRFPLEVVTPEALRAAIEGKELLLRQRLEAIVEELTTTRELLVKQEASFSAASNDRSKTGLLAQTALFQAGAAGGPASESAPRTQSVDKPDENSASTQPSTHARALLRLTMERALQNGERAQDETLGLSQAFEEILLELTNNRLDTEELRVRLQEGIAYPLKECGEKSFPVFEEQMRLLLQEEEQGSASMEGVTSAVDQLDAILTQLRQVLSKMKELEDFNEILDMLRSIMSEQDSIGEETEKRRKQKVLDLLGG